MNITDIMANKTIQRDILKSKLALPKRSKILVWVCFSNQSITSHVLDWLEILPANFVVFGENKLNKDYKNISFVESIDDININSLDWFLWACDTMKLEELMKAWVVPLVNEKCYLWSILQEFHPGRAEWNAYIYEKDSSWSAYYALIRYLENHKFPYDNRNLVKNVLWV